VELEQRGVPTVTICTDAFRVLGRHEADSLGMADLPLAIVPHPLGGQPAEQVRGLATRVVDEIHALLTGTAGRQL
jgi:hypothetical protein